MRKTKSVPTPLKARSLSDLRDLQRQATRQTKANEGVQGAPDHDHRSPDDPAAQRAGKRRPHRFLPPRSGAIKTRQTHDNDRDPHLATSVLQTSRSVDTAVTMDSDVAVDSTVRIDPAPKGHPAPSPDARFITPTEVPDDDPVTLDPEDVALFRRVVQSVTPAARSNRALLPPVPAAAPGQLRQRRQHAAGQPIESTLDVSDQYAPAGIDHDDTVFLQAGQGPHLIKGLKKGKWQIQASLDLHGATLDDARERMDRFIQSCRDHQIRCVRIVHGKGYGSKNGDPVLKDTVRRWLSQLAVVQAYTECDEADGGAGAVLALLTKQQS